jgi:hypothetical protein
MDNNRCSWLLALVHAAALATAAKSFCNNVARMRLAAAMAAWRRRLAHLPRAEDIAAFDRDGFILEPDNLPTRHFAELKAQALGLSAPARGIVQGDALTRRIPLDATTLPRLSAVRASSEGLNLLRHVGSSALIPATSIQTVFARVRPGVADPQLRLHADTFHSTVKAWFFLTDVGEYAGPFTYMPSSHRLTAQRLDWECHKSIGTRVGRRRNPGRLVSHRPERDRRARSAAAATFRRGGEYPHRRRRDGLSRPRAERQPLGAHRNLGLWAPQSVHSLVRMGSGRNSFHHTSRGAVVLVGGRFRRAAGVRPKSMARCGDLDPGPADGF